MLIAKEYFFCYFNEACGELHAALSYTCLHQIRVMFSIKACHKIAIPG
jgi:hypothetical protein